MISVVMKDDNGFGGGELSVVEGLLEGLSGVVAVGDGIFAGFSFRIRKRDVFWNGELKIE